MRAGARESSLWLRFENPIVGKDAISRIRGRRSVVALTAYLLMLGGFGYAVYAISSDSGQFGRPPSGQIGGQVFSAMAIFQVVLIALFVPALTAGAISGERERQTLDMLLVSRVSDWRIVWGKLVASIAYALLLLAVSLPLFAGVFLFGGIDFGQFALTFLITAATALALGAISLLFSAAFSRSLGSTVASYGASFAYMGLTGVLGLIVTAIQSAQGGPAPGGPSFQANPFLLVNPVFGLASVLFQGIGTTFTPASLFGAILFQHPRVVGLASSSGPTLEVWQITVATELILVAVCLVAAVRILRRARSPRRSRASRGRSR
ncbi:MAG: ABC transporter permease [Candidatus Dormibacteraceae bacterium]